MNRFRSRALMVVFFGLLTVGQAYPFSAAWGLSKKNHPCCCTSEMAKPCHCNHGRGKMKCHEEKTPSYKAGPCGGGSSSSYLNFQGDPFVPEQPVFSIILVTRLRVEAFKAPFSVFAPLPEGPPPRVVG